MRSLILALTLVSSACLADYDVTAVMPATSGADGCRLYMDREVLGEADCGVEVTFFAAIADEGTYGFSYTAFNAAGETAHSPVTAVTLTEAVLPEDPATAPTISVACNPEPCPTITITIN